MNFTPKMNNNMMIGTAMLSTYANQANKDSIDLLIPFTKYVLQEKYNINDVIDVNEVASYLQEQFEFYKLPAAIIDKTLRRLCKKN